MYVCIRCVLSATNDGWNARGVRGSHVKPEVVGLWPAKWRDCELTVLRCTLDSSQPRAQRARTDLVPERAVGHLQSVNKISACKNAQSVNKEYGSQSTKSAIKKAAASSQSVSSLNRSTRSVTASDRKFPFPEIALVQPYGRLATTITSLVSFEARGLRRQGQSVVGTE